MGQLCGVETMGRNRIASIFAFLLISTGYVQACGGNWPQQQDKCAHVVEDKWKGNPPDKIDSDGVPVYYNRMGPVGVTYRKQSMDEMNADHKYKCTKESG